MGAREEEEAYHREDAISLDQALHAEPIERSELIGGKAPDGTPLTNVWWECPVCGSELDFTPAHDRDGSALPDLWRCRDCRQYEWVA
jgi:rubredoxin